MSPTCFTGGKITVNEKDGGDVEVGSAEFYKGIDLGWHPGWREVGEVLKNFVLLGLIKRLVKR